MNYFDERQDRWLDNLRKKYFARLNVLVPATICLIIIAVLAILLYFAPFVYIKKAGGGLEKSISGWNLVLAGFSRNFTSTSAAYGDMANPFYLAAKSNIETLASISMLSVFAVLAFFGFTITLYFVRKQWVYFTVLGTSCLTITLYLLESALAFSIAKTDVLTFYTLTPTDYSIGSLTILQVILMLVGVVVSTVVCYKNMKLSEMNEKLGYKQ